MVTRPVDSSGETLTISTKILGLNISGTKTIAVYGDMNGLIYEQMQIETPSKAPFLEGIDAVFTLADKLLKVCRAQGLSSPEVISVAVSGPLDLLKGMVLSPPDLPQWDNAPLKGRLAVRYNLPVFVEHRSHAGALSEYYFGAGTGMENLIFLDMEPVVSAGLILGGQVYHGDNDAAGDIGRIRLTAEGPAGLGRPGSLTGYASGLGMAELASLRYPERWPNAPDPYDLVHQVIQGDAAALAVVEEAADHLGKALLWLIYTLDPDMVILGHPGDRLGESLLAPLRDAVLRHGGAGAQQLPRLTGAKLGARLNDTAAIAAAVRAFKQRNQPAEI
jgi:glucokinase